MNSKIGSKIDLETHSIEQPTADRYQHKSWFGKLGQAIAKAFEPHQEPMFWKKRTRNGNVYWQGYDPVSNRSLEFGSEDESLHLDRSTAAISMTALAFSDLGQNVTLEISRKNSMNFRSNTIADALR